MWRQLPTSFAPCCQARSTTASPIKVDEMTAQVIRDAVLYSGVRLSVPSPHPPSEGGSPPRRQCRRSCDTPSGRLSDILALLDSVFHLLGYPLATVLAEKIVTMIERGVATTRERDFAEVVVLSRRYQIAASELLAAMNATAEHRQAVLRPLAALLGGLGNERQRAWSTFIASAGLEGLVPSSYPDAINLVAMFIDPLLDGSVAIRSVASAFRDWSRTQLTPTPRVGVDERHGTRERCTRRRDPAFRAENQRLRSLLGLDQASRHQVTQPWEPTLFADSDRRHFSGDINGDSPAEAKIALFRFSFAGREDVYALRWESSKTGKKGWSPAVVGGWANAKKPGRAYLPINEEVVESHLAGESHLGLYPLRRGDECRLLACDFDGTGWVLDAGLSHAAAAIGVPVALERSRSAKERTPGRSSPDLYLLLRLDVWDPHPPPGNGGTSRAGSLEL